MSSPYRVPSAPCPVCANAQLVRVDDRLSCDECGGVLLEDDAFAAAMRQPGDAAAALSIERTGSSHARCPQCHEAMATTVLVLGGTRLAGSFLRCTAHGIWAQYGVTLRGHGHGAASGPAGVAGAIANMPSGHGGMSAAMASIAGAFESRGAGSGTGLAISQHGDARPIARTPYISAHKGETLACPVCAVAMAYAGERWACATCAGAFVENDALIAMVTEMTRAPWQLAPLAGTAGTRPCPICPERLVRDMLGGVAVERCGEHGVFFEKDQLARVLLAAGTA
jgi:ribosomal protein S27AE